MKTFLLVCAILVCITLLIIGLLMVYVPIAKWADGHWYEAPLGGLFMFAAIGITYLVPPLPKRNSAESLKGLVT